MHSLFFSTFYYLSFSCQYFQLQLLSAAHQAELGSLRKSKSELQDTLQSMTSEITQLRSTVKEVSSERNALTERLRCHILAKNKEPYSLAVALSRRIHWCIGGVACGLFFSQMGQAFETQSAALHSLRNYIGQLAPEKEEKEQLSDAVEVKAI